MGLAELWMTLWESDHSILQSWPCHALSTCTLLGGAWEKPENSGRSPAQLFTSTEEYLEDVSRRVGHCWPPSMMLGIAFASC